MRTSRGITDRLWGPRRPGPGLLAATVEYQVGDRVECQVGERVWAQWFTARRLGDGELAAALAGVPCGLARNERVLVVLEDLHWATADLLDEAGLAVDAYLTGDGSWVRAVPASLGAALGRSPR